MKAHRIAAAAALSIIAFAARPALADDYPLKGGEYLDIAMITIDDGHNLDYAKFLADQWRKSQDYAWKQGWITGYEVDMNVDKRPGEPDLFLVTRFKSMPDGAEQERRNDAYNAYMKTTDAQMEAASGDRATYRHVMGSMLLQKLEFKDK